jgi:RNase H-fold protein (predicted Holliday junction resolvase)
MILGFDPGRDKCGIAVVRNRHELKYHEIIDSSQAISTLEQLIERFPVELIVMGNLTTSKTWKEKIESCLSRKLSIAMVDERNSSLEARERYWQMYPPRGLTLLIPKGMRVPPRPVDDIVAILLIERYLERIS